MQMKCYDICPERKDIEYRKITSNLIKIRKNVIEPSSLVY